MEECRRVCRRRRDSCLAEYQMKMRPVKPARQEIRRILKEAVEAGCILCDKILQQSFGLLFADTVIQV